MAESYSHSCRPEGLDWGAIFDVTTAEILVKARAITRLKDYATYRNEDEGVLIVRHSDDGAGSQHSLTLKNMPDRHFSGAIAMTLDATVPTKEYGLSICGRSHVSLILVGFAIEYEPGRQSVFGEVRHTPIRADAPQLAPDVAAPYLSAELTVMLEALKREQRARNLALGAVNA